MRSTVLGGRGFIGRHLVHYLKYLGHSVYVPERGDENILNKSLGHVYYCAGLTADYITQPKDTIEAHISLLARILDCAQYEKLIYLSSSRLYDGHDKKNGDESSCFNVCPQVPRHLYDLSKLTGESLCHVMGQGRAKVARLSCVYNDHTDDNGFLPILLNRVANAKRGDHIKVFSSPNFARDYVHISDVIRALVQINVKGTKAIYNVASGENLLNIELHTLIKELTGRYLTFDSMQEASPPVLININKIRDEFGLSPKRVSEQIAPWLKTLF